MIQPQPVRGSAVVRPGIPPALPDAYTAGIKPGDSQNMLVVLCDESRGLGAAGDTLGSFSEVAHARLASYKGVPADAHLHYLQAIQLMAEESNRRVYQRARKRASDMLRIALTAIAIIDRRAYIANLGGNSVFLVRGGYVRTLVAPDPAQPIVYAGEQEQVPRLSTTGRPDFTHSFVVNLAIDDRVVICTEALARRLAAPAPAGQPAAPDPRAARIGMAVLGHAADPAEAARELSHDDASNAGQALWCPLDAGTPSPRAVALGGGAIVLWCADAEKLRHNERAERRRQFAMHVFTLLALLIFVTSLLASTSSAIASYSRRVFAQTATTQAATAHDQPDTPTPTITPTVKPLVPLGFSPEPAIAGITIIPRAARTAPPVRTPTMIFTPSPTNTAMPTPVPPTATPLPAGTATSD